MRVLVTGATGFVGRWLIRELGGAGHEAVAAPDSKELDVTDREAVAKLVAAVRPDAIAHLAGVAYAPDAGRNPDHAFAVNEGGTRAVMDAAADAGSPVLVSGSSDVYGSPVAEDLPLTESSPLRTDQPYGRSKLAQERAALEIGAARQVRVVVTRSFNHTGPGQRPEFVAPALATRAVEAVRRGSREIRVGNLDVRRDIGDVRDVVRAYRLLLEGIASGTVTPGTVVNVATGHAVSIRHVLELIAQIVGLEFEAVPDPALRRNVDPPLLVGDPTRLRTLTGWSPEIPLETTIADLVASIDRGDQGVRVS